MSQISASNLGLVRRALAAADAGDRESLEEFMHLDLVVTLAGVSEPIVGREHWLGGVLEMAAAFPDLQTTVVDAVCEGDVVAVRSVLRGTHSGRFNGLAATGRSIEVMSNDFYRIESGRIVEAWIVTDTGTLFGQIS